MHQTFPSIYSTYVLPLHSENSRVQQPQNPVKTNESNLLVRHSVGIARPFIQSITHRNDNVLNV